MRCATLLGLCFVAAPVALLAQTAAPLSKAAATISAPDVARRIGIIADDSMMGRDTPSRGLDLTAQYVADQFRAFGLRPGGDSGSWFQRYSITRRRLDLARSRVFLTAGGVESEASFTTSARQAAGQVPTQPIIGPAAVVAGPLTAASAANLRVKDRIVLVPLSVADSGSAQMEAGIRALYARRPRALILMSDKDSVSFAKKIPALAPERTVIGTSDGPVLLTVRSAPLAAALQAAKVDLVAAHSAPATALREIPGLKVGIEMRDSITSSYTAPNTVGILEGSDPTLKHQYLVYSAHMDHIGITPGKPDSINNGADDDASGTVGVIELAEAFSRAGARPKRSIIFLTVSGEEKGLWGSDYFSAHPPVPIGQIVADINIDMIGRNWPDTIVAIGKEHSDLGATLNRVNAAHKELGMTAIDDRWPEERFYFRSDHYNFARRGVPILFFFNGVHEDYHEVTDSPDKINSDKEARIVRLLFYLGQEIANAAKRPEWKAESYKEIVEEKP
jgi:peptidase M28-like protein